MIWTLDAMAADVAPEVSVRSETGRPIDRIRVISITENETFHQSATLVISSSG